MLEIDEDGLEIIRPGQTPACPCEFHQWVPLMQGTKQIGNVCIACGRTIREQMEQGASSVDENGVLVS